MALLIFLIIAGFSLVIFFATRSFHQKPVPTLRIWFFLVMAGLGGWLLVEQLSIIQEFEKLKQFPMLEAKIISSKIAGTRAFHPEIVYQYSVDGIVYTDTTDLEVPGFGTKANRHWVAEYSVDNFPAGKIVIIHYDAANPSLSFVKPHPNYTIFLLLSCGGLLFGIGIYFLIAWIYVSRFRKS